MSRLLLDSLTLILSLTFDLIFIGGRGIVIRDGPYLCVKFGDFSFSRFGFIARTDRQTDRIPDADQRYTHATTLYRRRE